MAMVLFSTCLVSLGAIWCLLDSALLLLYLCLDFPPSSILPCHRPKQLYPSTNENNTHSQHRKGHPTAFPGDLETIKQKHRPCCFSDKPSRAKSRGRWIMHLVCDFNLWPTLSGSRDRSNSNSASSLESVMALATEKTAQTVAWLIGIVFLKTFSQWFSDPLESF